RGEPPGVVVVEEVVPEPDEGAGETALRPRESREVVGRAVVRQAGTRVLAPRGETIPPGGPLGRIVGRGQDLRPVEAVERPFERDVRVQVQGPRDERIEGHAKARLRATSVSSVIPSRPGSELAKRPWSGADQRSSIGRSAPTIEPTAAPFVSVSQPP